MRSLIGRGLCGGPQIGIINKFPKAAQPRFSPISGPFWVRVGVRVRVGARVRGWVGSAPVPLFDQEVLSARKRAQPTAPKIPPANLLGELADREDIILSINCTYTSERWTPANESSER